MMKVILINISIIFALSMSSFDINSNPVDTIEECSAALVSGGSCVPSIGDVCAYGSEWFIHEVWESDEDDDEDCDGTEVCED